VDTRSADALPAQRLRDNVDRHEATGYYLLLEDVFPESTAEINLVARDIMSKLTGKKSSSLPPLQIDLGVNGALALDVQPLSVTTNSTLAATTNSTLTTKNDLDTNSAVKVEADVKPLVLDVCLKLGLERLPSTAICRDGCRHFGITLLGIEVIGFDYEVNTTTNIQDLANRPFVVGKPADHRPGASGQGIRLSV